MRSTLLQARGKWRRPIICRCRALRLSVQRREPVSFLRRCATVSAWCCVWELYEPKELAKIVTRSAGILGIDIEADGALEIASRSRGTPRIANRMLKRVRDFAQIMSDGVITYSTAKIALDRLEIDELGLDSGDRRMLNAIIQYYNGGPVGVETLAAAIGEEAVTIEDVVEPYLMQIGFLQRTPRGRCATRAAYLHLGLTPPGTVADDNPRFDV